MAKNKEIEVFGLSFMDLISCGLGGMLVLMFVFSTLVKTEGVSNPVKAKKAGFESTAMYERQLIFNTNFVLNISVPSSVTIDVENRFKDKVRKGFKTFDNTTQYVFFFTNSDEFIEEIAFNFSSAANSGEMSLMGGEQVAINPGSRRIIVSKSKSKYLLINE